MWTRQDAGVGAGYEVTECFELVADADTRAAWAAARARHQPWGSRAARGHAQGTRNMLAACSRFTLVCQAEDCGALVHWLAARRRARAAGRVAFAPGDGCTSRSCAKRHRPSQFLASQCSMAAGLQSGTRRLVKWPSGLDARALDVRPQAAAQQAAALIVTRWRGEPRSPPSLLLSLSPLASPPASRPPAATISPMT